LWVGSAGGFWRLTNGIVQEVELPGRPFRNVQTIFEDEAGRLWVANRTRLLRRTDGRWANVRLGTTNQSTDVRALTDAGGGEVWAALWNRGLARVGEGALETLEAKLEPALATIRCLHRDREGAVWIGTAGNGLLRYAAGRFTQWTTRHGLTADDISGLAEDAESGLWMTSNNGLFGCSKAELADVAEGRRPRLLCHQFGVRDGLADAACSGGGQPAIMPGAEGRLWFCNMRAVAGFAPGAEANPLPPPTVQTEEVRVDGVPSSAAVLRVPASARRFEFHFTAAQLENPRGLVFRYRLEGMDPDWMDGGNERVAYYSQLPAGRYQFRVLAGSSRHGWQSPTEPIVLEVIPLWWQRTWVRVAAATVLVAAIAGAAVLNERRKLRRRLERLEAQQALENERRRIARDLHDDLGAQLTEIVLVGELAKRGEQTAVELQHQVGDMTRMVRKLVAAMEEVVWTVNPRNDSVPNLATYLCDFVERFLAQTRHTVFLAFKEAANNAVKHSGATEIRLDIHTHAGALVIVLADNGRGFDPANPPATASGNGLANMRSRLEAAGGRAEISSVIGQGTTVKFELPFDRAALKNGAREIKSDLAD
jgi:signal transduction histidine kinase/streptogramin lyase